MASTTLLLGTAKALNFVLKDLYDGAKGEIKKKFSHWRSEKEINCLYRKIFDIRNVKTIWKIDKKINLTTFYYPSKLLIEDNKVIVNGINKIKTDNNILIEGTVGQGKSIFMRYLCSQELVGGITLPVFFQLRKMQQGETILQNIFKVLNSWNFNIDEELFDYIAKKGRMVLLLDGFDELNDACIQPVINELESLSEKYRDLKIIVSSRPKSGLENSPWFDVYKLAPLEASDHYPFLMKLLKDVNEVEKISIAIRESKSGISQLLTTPLMMTLMVFVYQAEKTIPKQLSDFYENLFPLLFDRHDKSKPGYVRTRGCSLSQRDVQRVFEAFCYITAKAERLEFTHTQIHSYVESALSTLILQCDPNKLLSDITKISCLIVEDGLSYYFIHKSVQEYHAACFIKGRPDDFAVEFYRRMLDDRIYRIWSNVIAFLSEIDKYRYSNYLLIPEIDLAFKDIGLYQTEVDSINKDVVERVMKDVSGTVSETHFFESIMLGLISSRLVTSFKVSLMFTLNNLLIDRKFVQAKRTSYEFVQVVEEYGLWDRITSEFKKCFITLKDEKDRALVFLKSEKDMSSILP